MCVDGGGDDAGGDKGSRVSGSRRPRPCPPRGETASAGTSLAGRWG